ncbi:MAG TPA: hypothetical protein VF037_01065 [Gemmatimonadales bacterium]
MRIAIAIFLALHGFAHVVGFAGSFGLAESVPYKTTVLGGTVDLGDAGMRAFGILWLVGAAAFLVASASAMSNQDWWVKATLVAASFSLVLSLMALPEARIGVLLDGLIIAAIVATRAGLLRIAA